MKPPDKLPKGAIFADKLKNIYLSVANLLTRREARRIALNMAKLPGAGALSGRSKSAHSEAAGSDLFEEQLIYEQSVARTVREQQEKRTCVWSRQPLKIEQLRRRG